MRDFRDYLALDRLPHMWCAGCGNGTVLGALARALGDLDLDPSQVVVVTGIGCWGKADDYMRTNALHGTHGRALAFATGIKGARPSLTVVALMGDGDCMTIGGNHLIHAARRNLSLTAVMVNNYNYGMTGGQYSATTPYGCRTTTSRKGCPEDAFDACALVTAAGAAMVARTSVFHPVQTRALFRQALTTPGFCFVEVASTCPTHFGRLNHRTGPAGHLEDVANAAGNPGVICKRKLDDFHARYWRIHGKADEHER
ncbi:MAG: thiamine pyrophosphate-dependent enzyme [Bacillota bacterium]